MYNKSRNVDRFAPNQWCCGRISHGIMAQGPNNDDGVRPGGTTGPQAMGGSAREDPFDTVGRKGKIRATQAFHYRARLVLYHL